jgi:hypothetical protein
LKKLARLSTKLSGPNIAFWPKSGLRPFTAAGKFPANRLIQREITFYKNL